MTAENPSVERRNSGGLRKPGGPFSAYWSMQGVFRDDREKRRFELAVGGQIVFARYARNGSMLAITHVEAPPALRGTGAADRLMADIMETARGERLKVRPVCGYASFWIQRHSEYHDLLG